MDIIEIIKKSHDHRVKKNEHAIHVWINSPNICRILAAQKRFWPKLNCCQWKCENPAKYMPEVGSLHTSPWLISIGSRNGLAKKNLCCMESTLDVYELKYNKSNYCRTMNKQKIQKYFHCAGSKRTEN